ncbi:MAG TPA: hypothetical protein VF544_20420 [Pyrinomonadaceae bacterium]|jgi:hypothetical protein
MKLLQSLPDFLQQYSDNKLVIALASALATVLLTKLLPYVWSKITGLTTWLGALLGGRLAFRSFEQNYLDWVVTELRELRLTGIVSQDTTKKPQLEQVFVSLKVAPRREQLTPETDRITDETLPLWLAYAYQSLAHGRPLRKPEGLTLNPLAMNEVIEGLDPESAHLFNATFSAGRKAHRERLKEIVDDLGKFVEAESSATRAAKELESLDAEAQLKKILEEHPRIAILGGPGAGKTTLLQHIALAYARERAGDKGLRRRGILKKRLGVKRWRLPLFIPLISVAGKLARTDETGRVPSIIEVLPKILPPDLQAERIAREYFTHQLEKENCIVLLDGLDEVPTDEEFRAVVRAIESLALRYKQNQFVITSRIAGWRSGVNADFQLFYVNDLTDEQVSLFIDSWYAAVERNAVVGRLEDESAAERKARERRAAGRAGELKVALRENEGVRRLATNPMLLSIIALVHRSLATLPKERSKLYDQCTNTLLEQWDISRGIRVDDTNLKLEQKQAIMRRLAIAFHTGEIGERNGGREATQEEVLQIISELLPSLGRSEDEAHRLLQRLIERSGIIAERRRGVVAFAHHTFQEYFTAQYLAIGEHIEHRDFLLSRERLMSDWWREVILLYAGLISDTSTFLHSVYDPRLDDLCRQRLRLALLCLGESVKVSDPELRQAIIFEALKVRTQGRIKTVAAPISTEEFNYLTAWAKSEAWYLNAAIITAQRASDAEQRATVLERLRAALIDIQAPVRLAAIESASFLPAEAVIPEIIADLRPMASDPDDQIRARTLRTFAKIDNSAETLQLLAKGLRDRSSLVVEASIEALKDFDVSIADDGQLISVVGPMLTHGELEVRRIGMRVFPYTSKHASEEQVNAFLQQARFDSLDREADEALEAVFTSGASELLVSKALESLPSFSRYQVRDIVRAIGNSSPDAVRRHDAVRAITSLLAFEDDLSWADGITVPFMSLIPPLIEESLLKLSRKGLAAEVTERLTALLDAESSKVQVRAIGALCRLHEAHPEISLPEGVESRLLKLLDDDPAARADALSILPYDSIRDRLKAEQQQQIRMKLLALIDDRDLKVRTAARRAWGTFGSAEFNSQVIDACLRDLNSRDFKRIDAALRTLVYLPGITDRKDISQKLMKLVVKRRPFGILHLIPPYYNLALSHNMDFRLRVIEVLTELMLEDVPEEPFDSVLKMVPLSDYSISYLRDSITPTLAKAGQYLPPSSVVDRLAPFLQSDKATHRVFALYLMAALPWKVVPPTAIAHSIAMLDDKNQWVRLEAINTARPLLQLTQAKSLLSAARKRLEDEVVEVRARAWTVIEEYNREQGVWA